MTVSSVASLEAIEKAVETLRKLRPAYESHLAFYKEIFLAQEKSALKTTIEPFEFPEDILSRKVQDELPLIGISEFKINQKAADDLFFRLCRVALQSNEMMVESAEKILKALEKGKIVSSLLFENLLAGDDGYFKITAQDIKAEKEVLAFLVYNSIKPSLVMCSRQLSIYLNSKSKQGKGYCPVCGSIPGLSTLEGEGERFLHCAFCWCKWHIKRIFCPFCENDNPKKQQYFYSREEEEYRVDTCDQCKKYIKTIDTRKMDRDLYPPLEQIATLHLDIKAKEMGLESPI